MTTLRDLSVCAGMGAGAGAGAGAVAADVTDSNFAFISARSAANSSFSDSLNESNLVSTSFFILFSSVLTRLS